MTTELVNSVRRGSSKDEILFLAGQETLLGGCEEKKKKRRESEKVEEVGCLNTPRGGRVILGACVSSD